MSEHNLLTVDEYVVRIKALHCEIREAQTLEALNRLAFDNAATATFKLRGELQDAEEGLGRRLLLDSKPKQAA